MNTTRIAELLAPFYGQDDAARLADGDRDRISMYIDILMRWNSRINLTAIRDPEEIVTRHFGESLFAARHLFPHPSVPSVVKGLAVADIGSGAGFPGIPIKLWAPDISLTLIESNHKKATFLREVCRVLTLTDVDIKIARAETIAHHAFDVVTLRAVERFETVLPAASQLVACPGRLALLIGSAQLPKAHFLIAAHKTPAGSPIWSHTEPVPLSESRILAIATYQKSYG